MTINLTEQDVIDTGENLLWTVRFETQSNVNQSGMEKYVSFYKESPAGEDIEVCVFYEDIEDIPSAVHEYYIDFDPEEHVHMWLEAKRNGIANVPYITELVEDSIAIERMILKLYLALQDCYERKCHDGEV